VYEQLIHFTPPPIDPRVHFELAALYEQAGKIEKAEEIRKGTSIPSD